jgi:hypothetical protein
MGLFDDLVPQQSKQAGLFDDLVPSSGAVGANNPQYNDAGAARLGTSYGQSQANQQPSAWNRATAMANRLSSIGLIGLTAPAQAVLGAYSHTGLPGAQAAGQTVNNLQSYGNELISGAPQALGLPSNQQGYDLGGVGDAIKTAGSMVSGAALGQATGLNSLIGGINSYLPQASSYLGRAASSGLGGVVGGTGYGALNAATTPVAPGDTYANHLAQNLKGGALTGGVVGAAIPMVLDAPEAIGNGMDSIKSGGLAAKKIALGTSKVSLPGEILTGESVNDVMANAQSNPAFEGKTIPEIQLISQGTGENASNAKSIIQRLTVAAGNENSVGLSIGDISQDPKLQIREQGLEGAPGNVVLNARQTQGSQIRQAIMDQQSKYDGVAQSTKYDFDTPSPYTQPMPNRPLNPEIDDIDSMTPTVSEAAGAGDKGAQYLQTEMAKANTNPKIIQASLEGQFWKNRQISSAAYNSFNDYLNGAADGELVDVSSTVQDIKQARADNRTSPGYDPAIEELLKRYETNLTNPSADMSYPNVQKSISQMEGEIEDLKASGNRSAARTLFQVKNGLNGNVTNFVQSTLADDPGALATFGKADTYYKQNVLPFQDPDSGISKIMNGIDADKAVSPLFTDSSPDQFSRIFLQLDSKGQAAVRAEMVGRTEDAATRMKNFQGINIPSVARFLENRSDQVATAFGNDNSISALSNLIRNIPRAGYQSNLAKSMSFIQPGNILRSQVAGGVGAGLGGLPGYAMGIAAETGGEIGYNNMIGKGLMAPNLGEYTRPVQPVSPSAPVQTALPFNVPTLADKSTSVPSSVDPGFQSQYQQARPMPYQMPALSDSSTLPTQPPRAMPYVQRLGMYPSSSSTGLATPGLAQLPEYKPPVPLGGPVALAPQTPALPPYPEAVGRLNY